MSDDCFGHAFLITVKITGALLRTLHAVVGGKFTPVLLVSNVRELQAAGPRRTGPPILSNPQFNYEPFNSNSVNIRFWSWNYRGCWHQTCPPIDTRFWMALNIPHCLPSKA